MIVTTDARRPENLSTDSDDQQSAKLGMATYYVERFSIISTKPLSSNLCPTMRLTSNSSIELSD